MSQSGHVLLQLFLSSGCPDSRYGYMCTQECQCANEGVCSHVDGSCGCGPGWMGTYCDQGESPHYNPITCLFAQSPLDLQPVHQVTMGMVAKGGVLVV